jgi:hypothetical protein
VAAAIITLKKKRQVLPVAFASRKGALLGRRWNETASRPLPVLARAIEDDPAIADENAVR